MKNKLATFIAASALLFAATDARAALLLPGAAVAPSADVALPDGAALDSVVAPFAWSIDGKNIAGTLTSAVYDDAAYNPLGLTFVYTLDLTSAAPRDNLRLLTLNSFAGFLTLVSQLQPAPDTNDAISADRSVDGNKIQFAFNTPPSAALYTQGTATLIVRTDANSFRDTEGAVSDGLTRNVPIIAPDTRTITTPDGGATAVLLGLGLIGLVGVRRKLNN